MKAQTSRRHTLTWLGVYLTLSVAFCWPLFAQPLAAGSGDWDQHLFYYASVLHNAAFGQLPFWNPWYCGGNVLWANPQVSLISPVYLLALVMPLALAMKINIVGHYLVGCLGMHLLVRRLIGVQSPFIVVYLVSLFVFSGATAMHLEAGHSDFLSVLWLPALVYCFWQAVAGHRRSLLLGGAILAVSILNGGPHAVPLAAVLLGGLGLGALVFGRTVKPFILAVAIVALGCVYAAPRLVPSAMLLTSTDFHDTRPVKHPDAMSAEMLTHALWDASQGTPTRLNRTVQLYGWQEYGGYMGWFGAGLALICAGWILLFRWRREYWREASAAFGVVAFLLLTAGEFANWAPATVMAHLPFFSSFRIPSRHIILLPFVGAMCAAYAVRVFESGKRGTLARRVIELICVVGLVQLVMVNRAHFREVFILPPVPAESRLFDEMPVTVGERDVPRVGGPDRVLSTNMFESMLAGVSPLNCWEPLQLRKVAALGPVVIAGVGDATFSDSSFSPNRMSASVQVGPAPVRAVLNQNFGEGWSSNVGPVEHDPASGRPSVMLPAAYSGLVTFTFVPPGLWMGLAIFVIAIALSILAWRRSPR
jgi:hypothetical protein